jgi:hypothetical protein
MKVLRIFTNLAAGAQFLPGRREDRRRLSEVREAAGAVLLQNETIRLPFQVAGQKRVPAAMLDALDNAFRLPSTAPS